MEQGLSARILSISRTASLGYFEGSKSLNTDELAAYMNIEYDVVFGDKDPIDFIENAEQHLQESVPFSYPKLLNEHLSFRKKIFEFVVQNILNEYKKDSKPKAQVSEVYQQFLEPLLFFFNISRKYYQLVLSFLTKTIPDEINVSYESVMSLFAMFKRLVKFFSPQNYPSVIGSVKKTNRTSYSYTIKCIRAYSTKTIPDDPSELFDGKICIKDFPMQKSVALRPDNLIIFGTNACCDIILPKAEHLEAISVVLFIGRDNISVKDYLKTSYCLVQLLGRRDHFEEREFPAAVIWKPELPQQSLRLKRGMVINIGRVLNLHIESIKYNINRSEESELILRYLNSEMKYKTETISNFKTQHFTTRGNEEYSKEIIKQNNFTLGKGSKGVAPDIHIPSKFESVCGRHCEFIFDEQQGWHICDENSKNGTYFITKTSEDLANSRPSSKAFKLFRSNSDKESPPTRSIFLLIANKYRFLIEAQKIY